MFCSKKIQDVLKELNSNSLTGLNPDEVNLRKEKFGENKLASQKKQTKFQLFISQINDILIYILIAAAIISALVGELSDSIIITVVIIINAVVGIIQESKAEKSLEALKTLSTPKAIVKRDGSLKEISSEEIVPGDIVIIDAGRYIPCDLRLLESVNLKIDESALTGESVPATKDATLIITEKDIPLGEQKNMAFMSTLVSEGRGIGIATKTGMNTEIGKVASLLKDNKKELTPLQKKLEHLGKILGLGAVIICFLIFIIGILQKRDLFEMFLTSISLAVAAVPEGLPAIVTIVLALGVQRMIKCNAIIRKLPAVETLGSVNIICSDKTGTLTQNKMTVTKFFTYNTLSNIEDLNINNEIQKLLLKNLVLCNDATYSENSKTGDPTEIALLDAGVKFNIFKDDLSKIHPRINEAPFDSDRKMMSTVNKIENKFYVMTKGAVDNIINLCNTIYIDNEIVSLTSDIKDSILKSASLMSQDALRVLCAAYKQVDNAHIPLDELEKDLTFIGLVGMIDPPRIEVKDSINLCKMAGIKTIMITGDHKATALAIAKSLNICEDEKETMSGSELNSLSDEELNKKVDNLKVFARVSPEHKVKIVKALKSKGNIVSMTGDGVNDAPSLKIADIGVAMGITGTDVSKNAADMILTDDNFSTIVSAIEEGRNIYNNIKKSVLFLLSCNLGELISILVAIVLGWSSPLRSIHILWINLVTDSLPALALGVDTKDKSVMDKHPRDPKESIFHGSIQFLSLNTIIIGALTLIAFYIGMKTYPNSLNHAQTMAFMVMSISELIHSLNMRSQTKSIFKVGFFTNKLLLLSIFFGIFLQSMIVVIPFFRNVFKVHILSMYDLMWIIILGLVPLLFNELLKLFNFNKAQ